jgi:transcriptional regulator with XRE-family HTH domain
MKTAERELARALRREHGVSVKRLARMLGVSTSSVSLWVRDIELRPEQIAALRQAAVGGARHHRAAGLARRRAAQAHGRGVARFRDPNHIAACMLYWAEGSRNRHVVEFVNSDPAMMRFFVAFIRRWFPEAERKIRVTCNLFADHAKRQREIEDFWLALLGLPREALRKTSVNRYSKHSEKKRRNKLPHGTCRVNIADTRIVQHLYGAIQEYGGFEREEWLG